MTTLTLNDLFRFAEQFSEEPGTVFLCSGGTSANAEHSFLCLFPYESIKIEGRTISHTTHQKTETTPIENPWEAFKNILNFDPKGSCTPCWVGYFSYEMGAYADLSIISPHAPPLLPDAYFYKPTVVITVDHVMENSTLFIDKTGEKTLSIQQKAWLQEFQADSPPPKDPSTPPGKLLTEPDSDLYVEKIEAIQSLIHQGTVYQVNLSHQIEIKAPASPFSIFKKLFKENPAPFMAYLCYPEFQLTSSSPERLLKKSKRLLETQPIKGTAPRGKTKQDDHKNKRELLKSEKEKAELLMITDLMRNDLSKVSEVGSVTVKKLCHCDAYSNVFHLSSVIQSITKKTLHPVELLRALFPGGSITGCPKLKAMEIIHHFEERPRGIYTGSIGYFSENGDLDFNIAIRTFMTKGDIATIQIGGAIVSDSSPQKEFEETLHKGSSILRAFDYTETTSRFGIKARDPLL